MNFLEYQCGTSTTAIYSEEKALEYLTTGLASEAGEVAGKIAKSFRGDKPLDKEAVLDEVGDVLWFCSELASYFGADLGEVAENNLAKLQGRAKRGTLKGDGDSR